MAQTRTKRFNHIQLRGTYSRLGEQEFTCIQCNQYVSCDPGIAGVANRNHCPYCLWSRHLDWRTPGDRLASCRAAMQPIGLTTKPSRNKYATERGGELMIVHRCIDCEKVVINRIAADDSSAALMELFTDSSQSDTPLTVELTGSDVYVLTEQDSTLFHRRLFGETYATTYQEAAYAMEDA